MRSMHPIMVWVLVVAVTIVVSFLAVSYIMTTWQAQQAIFTVRPLLFVRSSALGSNLVLELYVTNEGVKATKILGVEVIVGNGRYVNNTVWVVGAGEKKLIRISDWNVLGSPGRIVPGERYRVLVYVEEFGAYMYDVVAQ